MLTERFHRDKSLSALAKPVRAAPSARPKPMPEGRRLAERRAGPGLPRAARAGEQQNDPRLARRRPAATRAATRSRSSGHGLLLLALRRRVVHLEWQDATGLALNVPFFTTFIFIVPLLGRAGDACASETSADSKPACDMSACSCRQAVCATPRRILPHTRECTRSLHSPSTVSSCRNARAPARGAGHGGRRCDRWTTRVRP